LLTYPLQNAGFGVLSALAGVEITGLRLNSLFRLPHTKNVLDKALFLKP
jgi:hypothetical protein